MIASTTVYYYDSRNRKIPIAIPDQDWDLDITPLDLLDGVVKTEMSLDFSSQFNMLIGGGGGYYIVTVIGDNFGPYQLLGPHRNGNTMCVRFGGVDSDMPSKYVVMREHALQAARYFRSSMALMPDLEWELC